ELRLRRIADGRGELVAAELREQLRELAARRAEVAGKPLGILRRKVVPERLDEREIGERKLRLATRAPQDLPAEPVRVLGELPRQPRLAHARLAAEGDEAALAAVRGEQRVLQDEEWLVPADERGAEGPLQHEPIVPFGPPADSATGDRARPVSSEGAC